MKIAVIGGASSYTPELIDGLFARLDAIPVTEVWLMDPNAARLEITSDFARRMSASHGNPFSIHHTDDLSEAVRGAAYVITQIRVGGARARIEDEKLGLRHGIVGQETTGVGGFACALRTIPAVLDVARAMEALAPEGFLVNFTNPAGIVTEALIKHSAIGAVGLCNIPIGIAAEAAKYADCAVSEIELDYVGLNHLSWVRACCVGEADVTAKVFGAFIEHAAKEWEVEAVRDGMCRAMESLGMVCNPYLQYYYATGAVLEHMKTQGKTRGEEVLEIEEVLFGQYGDPAVTKKPEALSRRGGAHYSTAAFHLIDAIQNNRGDRQIVCCRNDGAVPTFDEDAAVEVPAIIGKAGVRAIPQAKPEPAIRGLMQAVKAYESLTVEAAVRGDRELAFQAMLAHPLMPGALESNVLLDELLEINEPHLQGTFF